MKTLSMFLMCLMIVFIGISAAIAADGPEYAIAAGASYNPYASAPEISGNILFAKRLADKTYSFTFVDVVSRDQEKFAPATSFTEGIGIETININDRVRIFATTGIGVIVGRSGVSATSSGDTVGYSWNIGPAMSIGLGKGWFLMPNARYFKSGLTDSGWIGGVLVGWGH